ncbi:uncharacterized protein Rrp45 [Euwallacea fornicatus]|uniref:uncharacterized protein Rrp45 n=1 Tax=Euwallacea fornicatus TaxID=995702 RepID=UPI00338FACBB
MLNVRKITISNPEKQFLIKNLKEWTRLDGRSFDECREVKIEFGKDWGCCFVSLGKTQVIAQVTCELQEPNSSRPSEGILNINLELTPMGDSNFEPGRQTELFCQLNRFIEKCIKDSRALDLESLCVKMNERVWALRVDVNLINHEGNILDCASIAVLAALAHFRRPDVTADGMDFKIHNIKERDPIPTVIHHYPICVSYAIFSGGDYIIIDPTLLEERVADASLNIGLNAYKELCGLHLGGKAQVTPRLILETTNKAANRAGKVVEMIKAAVEKDTNEKLAMKDTGFHTLELDDIDVSLSQLSVCLDHWKTLKTKKKKTKLPEDDKVIIKDLNKDTAELIPIGSEEKWIAVKSDEDSENDDQVMSVMLKDQITKTPDTESEEDEVVVLKSNLENTKQTKKKRHT